jgi:hypothetical protein
LKCPLCESLRDVFCVCGIQKVGCDPYKNVRHFQTIHFWSRILRISCAPVTVNLRNREAVVDVCVCVCVCV